MKNGDVPSEIVIFPSFLVNVSGPVFHPNPWSKEGKGLICSVDPGSRGCLEQHVMGDMAGSSETIDFPMENHCL